MISRTLLHFITYFSLYIYRQFMFYILNTHIRKALQVYTKLKKGYQGPSIYINTEKISRRIYNVN